MSPEQESYFQEQLRYDHVDHSPPPNTLVVHQKQHSLIRQAVREYAAHHPIHMLDIGCGWGDFSGQLDPYIKTYVGIEPSLGELRQFQARPNRFLVHGVGEFADFIKDKSRNFILLNSVLDHGFDWQRMFQNALRILAPGGLIVISMENSRKLIIRVREALGKKAVHEGHLSYWSLSDVQRLLGAEFRIISQNTFGFLFGFHALTRRVPLPLPFLRLANGIADGFCTRVAPEGGHILFVSAVREGSTEDGGDYEQPFRCAKCKSDMPFGAVRCLQCGAQWSYIENRIMDSMEMNPLLKNELAAG